MITQKKYFNLIALLVALITGMVFLPGLSNAAVTVEGEVDFGEGVVDFGEVVEGTKNSATFYISNPDISSRITLDDVTLESTCGFSITSVVPEITEYGIPLSSNPIEIHIDYIPLSLGECQGSLSIFTTKIIFTTNNWTSQRDEVELILSGTGIKAEITVDPILEFVNACVADGSLIGYVPNKSHKKRSAYKITKGDESDKLVENRLNAFRNMIETAGELIDSGKIDEACGQLKAVYKKIKIDDGLNTAGSSNFFVKGDASSELADYVKQLMAKLECK
jgi:hypothetical protein